MRINIRNTKTRTTVDIVPVKSDNCTIIISPGLVSVKVAGEDDHHHVQFDPTKQTLEVTM